MEMKGALASDWTHFDLVLGLGEDLLPVVPDEGATPTAGSAVKKFGKIPSVYDHEGNAHGLAKWQTREITAQDIARWSADRRLSMCVRCSAVRAIDVDVTAAKVCVDISNTIGDFPMRRRANSNKFLVPFRMEGEHKKRIINTEYGRIEFLANGQQFVAAGSHPSGALYEWSGGLPDDIPLLSQDQFEHLWARLSELYAIAGSGNTDLAGSSAQESGGSDEAGGQTLAEISPEDLERLRSALGFQPLLLAAADNSIWSEVGYGLLSLKHDPGFRLFAEFSRAAPNHTPNAAEDWWQGHYTAQPRSDYRHIFTLARKLGWGAQAELEAFGVVVGPVVASRSASVADDLIAPPPDRPTIRLVEGRLHEYARAAEDVLNPLIYTQGDRLIRLGEGGELDDGARRDDAQATMVQVSDQYIMRKLTALVNFEKWNAQEKKWVAKDCPSKLAVNIIGQNQWPNLRPLAAIARAPFLRRGGTICEVSGYDVESAVALVPAGSFQPILDNPSRAEALSALQSISEPFCEFPFATEASRSAFVAHILTEAARVAINTSPMFFYTAPNAGTGKTLLSAMPALIVHGNEPSIRPWVKDGDEVRKGLFASLLAGDRSIAFDNVPTGDKVRSAELCRFLTARDTYKDRRLGESEVVGVRNTAVVSASGNNINPAGDLARRSIVVRLDANTNALRARVFRIDDLHAHVLAYRDRLLPAALTIIRAYVLSGEHGPVPLPSFEEWSRVARDPLLWLGMPDPCETQEDEAEDEEHGALADALRLLAASVKASDFTARDISNACFTLTDGEGTLAAALSATGCKEPNDPQRVGYWLRHHRDQIAGNYKLERGKGRDGTQHWRLKTLGGNEDLF